MNSSRNDTPIIDEEKPRSSVRNRVLVGLLATMAVFAGLTIYSIVLHGRTIDKIALVNGSYLPLILGTTKISSNQVVFNIFMDRLADDYNQSVTREWIDASRQFRPSTLKRLRLSILRSLGSDIPADEARFLRDMAERLDQVALRYVENEQRFEELYALMDSGQVDEARVRVERLKRIERALNGALAGIGREVERHIRDLTEDAEDHGARATLGLGILTLAGLLISVVLLISTNALLTPLKALEAAVGRVAAGHLETRTEVKNDNEIGALARNFNRMTEALVERDKMLIRSERLATAGKMAAQVTHEIRNPLSSLGLNAELLEEELAGDDTRPESWALLGAIQDEIERLTGITESYLRYARLPIPEPDYGNLNETVKRVLEFMSSELAECHIKVEVELEEPLPPILFDDSQIRQALTNMIRNACEAMPDGGALTLTTLLDEERAMIGIRDTGPGITPEALEHIFESFYTTKSGGTGLGLPLVKQICGAHGGDVQCSATGDLGSTFTITLPIESAISEA